jgi:phenylpropionate dioxygenase-like ring-hydroxylating dioxygenase large terminal subunit
MPVPEYGPHGPMPGWAATTQYFEWDIDYKRSIENGIDPAHNEFVHDTHGFSYKNEATYKIQPLPCSRPSGAPASSARTKRHPWPKKRCAKPRAATGLH